MNKVLNIFVFMTVISLLFIGCGTSQLQTRAKLTRTVMLDKSIKTNKNIYIQVSNTAGSGGENLNLFNDLKANLESKGYKLVDTSKTASYGLFVNVLFANNLKEANAIKSSTSAAVIAGTSAGIAGASGGDSLIIGAVAALGSGVVGYALEDEIFRAVIDVEIRDYQGKVIQTARDTMDSGGVLSNTDRSGNMNALAGTIGNSDGVTDMESGIAENTKEYDTANYNKYLTRSFVEAIKMDLKSEEALPILSSKASAQIANLF